MSKVVIPSDWQDDEWDSFCIKWPKSAQYRGILLGLIYSMTRGRAYDETTGSVRDAQEIGKRILDANYPFSACGTTDGSSNGATNEPDYSYLCGAGWCNSDEENCEDDMSNCCLKNQIRLENGVLQVLDCGEWVDIGGVSSQDTKTSQPDSSTKTPQDTGDTEGDFRCAKASAIINTLWDVFQATFDHWDDLPWPVGAIENQVGLDLNNNWVSVMCIAMFDVSQIDKDMADIVHNNNKQTAICRLYPKLDGTTNGVSDNDWKQIEALMETLSSDPIEGSFIDLCIRAVGRGTFDRLCKVSILNMTGNDCGCPVVTPTDELIPITHTWSKVFDFKLGAYGFTGDSALNTLEYQAGVGWVCTGLDGGAMNVPIMGRTGAVDNAFPCNLLYYKIHVAQWPTNLSVAGGTPMTLKVGGDWKGSAAVQRGSEYITMILPGEAFNLATRIEWGWNEYFNGSGNESVQTVIDKLVIAGNGGDFWSLINPDGTVG